MKFTITTLTTTNVVLSPMLLAEDNNGTYEVLDGSNGQSGFCQKDGVNTDEKYLYETNCNKKMYHMFALNNCGPKVGVDFEHHTKEKGCYDKTVFIKQEYCKNIGNLMKRR